MKKTVHKLPNGDVKETIEYANELLVYFNGVLQEKAKEWVEFTPAWEKWFAWHPIKIDNKYRWMTTVYRRELKVFGDQRLAPPIYEYGTLFDVLKEDK